MLYVGYIQYCPRLIIFLEPLHFATVKYVVFRRRANTTEHDAHKNELGIVARSGFYRPPYILASRQGFNLDRESTSFMLHDYVNAFGIANRHRNIVALPRQLGSDKVFTR